MFFYILRSKIWYT